VLTAIRASRPPYVSVFAGAALAFAAELLLFGSLLALSIRESDAEWKNSVLSLATFARNSIEPELEEFRAGRATKEEAILEIAAKVQTMKYRDRYGDNYVFLGDFAGGMLVQSFNWELGPVEQQDEAKLRALIIPQLSEAARAHPSGSFLKYDYRPPGSSRPEPKLTYVIGIPELELLIGTGLYLEEASRRQGVIVGIGAAASLAVLALLLVPVFLALRASERANRLLREDVEARLVAEEDLKSSRKDLATVLESISDAILVHDFDGRVFRANKAAKELYGLPDGELGNLNVRDISADTPEVEARIKEVIERNSEAGSPRFDWKGRRVDDGSVIDLDVSLRRTKWEGRDAVVAVVRDAGPRRQAAEHAAWLAAIFRHVPLPFWAIDAEGRFVLQSAASSERLGQLVGRRLEEVLDTLGTPIDRIEAAAAGQTFVGERLHGEGAGRRTLIEILAPVPGMGDGAGILCIEIDISDRVRAEEEARRLNRDLERRVEERTAALLEYEKLAAIGRLAAGVAHELNTPLGAVLSSAETLREELAEVAGGLPARLEGLEGRPGAREAIASLMASGEGLSDLVIGIAGRELHAAMEARLAAAGHSDPYGAADDLIALGVSSPDDPRLDMLASPSLSAAVARAAEVMGALRLVTIIHDGAERAAHTVAALRSYSFHDPNDTLREVDIARQVDGILTLFRNGIKAGVEVVRRFEGSAVVLGHPEGLNQIWMNLVKNALQAMGYAGRLEVGLRDLGDEVEVYVEDSGPGIPPEVQARLFEPFFTTKSPGEGTGLGLEICRKNAELHGGRIRFESEPGRTVFTVRLPRRPTR